MIELKAIEKSYGKEPVLNQLSAKMSDSAGVYGLLGRNGAGKTTLMKIITQQISVYQGQVLYQGQDVSSIDLAQIVYVGGQIYQDNEFLQGKIKGILKLYQALYPNFDSDLASRLLAAFDLKEKQAFKKLSSGNQTLVQNIMGLATRAPITLMDEPTNGLDSVNRQKFFRFLMEDYQEHPRMFVLSTHLIQEVAPYLTHVLILKDGQFLVDQSTESLQTQAYRITNGPDLGKKVIRQEKIGPLQVTDIYDTLSPQDIQSIEAQGGKVDYLDLQSFFNDLMEA